MLVTSVMTMVMITNTNGSTVPPRQVRVRDQGDSGKDDASSLMRTHRYFSSWTVSSGHPKSPMINEFSSWMPKWEPTIYCITFVSRPQQYESAWGVTYSLQGVPKAKYFVSEFYIIHIPIANGIVRSRKERELAGRFFKIEQHIMTPNNITPWQVVTSWIPDMG